MEIDVFIVFVVIILSIVCYFLFKGINKYKNLYKVQIEKNKILECEIEKLKVIEEIKNNARKDTEEKITYVGSLDGADKFNAINNILSNNN